MNLIIPNRTIVICRERLQHAFRSAWKPPFRGQIYEYGRKINLQNGYALPGKFDVNKSRYLIKPFHALKDPRVRVVVILKAVQTGGSLLADIWVPYLIEHDPGEILWLLQKDDIAKKYAETRFMPLLKSIPEIAAMLAGIDRHDIQKTALFFHHMSLIMAGANENNVQTLSKRYFIHDEVWLSGRSGIVRQGKDRTTAFPYSCKSLLISQGGEEDDDMDTEHKATNQELWSWQCPDCRRLQPYEWAVRRDDNSWAGMRWDDNDTTKPGGKWNMSRVLETIRKECRYCPAVITDTPENRRRLNDSSDYLVTNPNALPDTVGFSWPAEANVDIAYAWLVRKYLSAKRQEEDFGNKTPLKEFYQKQLARAWTLNQDTNVAIINSEPYDIESEFPGEVFRPMTVDCQQGFERLRVNIRAWTAAGASRQLFRGWVESFEKVRELQLQFRVRDQHVFVDLGYEQTKAAAICVKYGHEGVINGRKYWLCWHGLKGSRLKKFRHTRRTKRQTIVSLRMYSPIEYISLPNSKRLCPFYQWSNLLIKDILARYRDGAMGRFQSLPDLDPLTDINSYSNQMHSEVRVRERDKYGHLTDRWVPVTKSRPNHDWDTEAMQIVAACIRGIIGEAEPVSEVEADESVKTE